MSVARNRKNILTFLQKNPPYSASCTYKWLSRVTCLNGVSQKIILLPFKKRVQL